MEPVDVEGLGLTDYYDIIKNPIDLSTIRHKLDAKQYATPPEFRDDVLLMCENCFIYNPEDQPVHKLGKELKVFSYFNQMFLYI